jgi:NitT/TauT family transport system substrate-binding protein
MPSSAVGRRVFLSGAAALVAAARPVLAQSALVPIKVGTDPTDTYAEPYYAEEMGFFKQAGLDAQVIDLQNGAAIAAAVASNAVDVGISTVVQLAQAVARGLPFVLVAGGAMYSSKEPTTVLCVAKNSPIATAKDLEGKVVAISALKTSSEIGVTAWVAENGADVAKVKLVEMPFAQMGPAIARGTIDAGLISEPALTESKSVEGVRVLAHSFDGVSPSFMLSVWFTTRAWVQANPDTLKRFVAATYESGAWANTHRAQTAAILAKVSKLELDTVRSMARSTMSDSLDVKWIQPQLDVAYKYGVLPKHVNAADMIVK